MTRQRSAGFYGAVAAITLAMLALGGCSSVRNSFDEISQSGLFHSSSSSTSDGGFTVKRGGEMTTLPAATASDFVGGNGQCQGAPGEGAATPRGVILTMTECELVAVAGPPDQTNVGADEAGDRRTVLTYTKGDHPGIYTFASGRLKIIERLPTAQKPEPRRRAPKGAPKKKSA
jgi:hypothetical protein